MVGIAEASMLTACMLGARFSIVTVAPGTVRPIHELASAYGLAQRLASCARLTRRPRKPRRPRGNHPGIEGAHRMGGGEDRADVAILAAPSPPAWPASFGRLPIPVLDGVACAVRQAELLAGLGRKA